MRRIGAVARKPLLIASRTHFRLFSAATSAKSLPGESGGWLRASFSFRPSPRKNVPTSLRKAFGLSSENSGMLGSGERVLTQLGARPRRQNSAPRMFSAFAAWGIAWHCAYAYTSPLDISQIAERCVA